MADEETSEDSPVVDEIDTVAFTIDDDEKVLELILSEESGIFVRDNGEWLEVDTDIDQPTIDDQEWLDVSDEAVAFWDGLSEDERDLTRDDVLEYNTSDE